MKKRTILLILVLILSTAAYYGYPFLLRACLNVSGTLRISPEFKDAVFKPNTMLFIILKNDGEIPVAVKKIINPSFPLNFSVTPRNLMLPDLLAPKLRLEVQINQHGQIGTFKTGDMRGELKDPVFIFSRGLQLVIDTKY